MASADGSGTASSAALERLELAATILLAVAAVATAWSSYQAARWSGEQAIAFSAANAARLEASRAEALANEQTAIDVSTFIAWTQAYATENELLEDFYFRRFRAEFRPALEAWIATRPLRNVDAPLTPFVLPEYQLEARQRAAERDAEAARQTELAKRNNQRSDNYVLAVVLFASSLFFAGISTKLARPMNRAALVGIGWVIFLGALAWVLTFPISFGL